MIDIEMVEKLERLEKDIESCADALDVDKKMQSFAEYMAILGKRITDLSIKIDLLSNEFYTHKHISSGPRPMTTKEKENENNGNNI